MFQFKQPSPGSLPFVQSTNGKLPDDGCLNRNM